MNLLAVYRRSLRPVKSDFEPQQQRRRLSTMMEYVFQSIVVGHLPHSRQSILVLLLLV